MTRRSLLVGLIGCSVIFLCVMSPNRAAPEPAKQEIHGPFSPEEALKLFKLPEGLRVELVAAEPDVQSPVAMQFDEDGRMWVVEMLDYPNGPEKGKPGEGRIKILEDKDGSGRFKVKSVFADQLLFANGVMPWKGGVIVTQAPSILYMKDTKGTGKADVRENLYEGFAAQNPQLRVSHPNLGIDNWVYVANGLRGGEVKRSGQDKAPINISGRDFRFDLIRGREEAITGMGQYGNTFDEWGRRFVCTNRNQWVHMVLPEHYVRRNPYLAVPPPHKDNQGPGGATRIFPISVQVTTAAEHAGSFTAACGVFAYNGSLLPQEYRGSLFTCDPTGNLIHQEVLFPKGATFTGRPARQGVEFLATTDDWCRPVFMTLGPDDALYFVDMYRKVIEHPEFLPKDQKNRPDLNEGKERGRIWRIVPEKYEYKKPSKQFNEALVKVPEQHLEADLAWVRLTAQRLLLTNRAADCESALRGIVVGSKSGVARVHAAWLLEHRGKFDAELALKLLRDDHPRVREHGARLSEPYLAKTIALQTRLIELADDPDAQLRFQVALSLGAWDDDRILKPLARIARTNVDDPWSRMAVASAVPTRAGALLIELFRSDLTKQTTPDRLQLVQELAALVGGRQDASEVADFLDALLALTGKDAGTWQMAGRKGLAEGMLRRGVQLSAFLDKLPKERRGLLEKMDALMRKTLKLARDGKGPAPERVEAVQMLAHTDWKTAEPVLSRLVVEEPAAEVRLAAVRALAAFPNPEVPKLLVQAWKGAPGAVQRELMEALLSQPERTLALLIEMEAGRIKPEEVDPSRRVQLLNHRRSDVRDRGKKLLAGVATAERKKILEDYKAALTLKGDVRRGKEAFTKGTCISCHKLGNLGVDVGPDISDTRTKSLEALLVDVLDPNAAIDANFVNYVVTLRSGKVLTGLIAAETASSITLRRADKQSDVVLRQDIEPDGIVSTGRSLMPDGLEKNLSVQEVADLLAFLRNWRELEPKK
ncbi:MAG: c-type cytochrome [Gemmataceae bacterium]|nr:c-type cytochrome [Gemmataceae bacterium]